MRLALIVLAVVLLSNWAATDIADDAGFQRGYAEGWAERQQMADKRDLTMREIGFCQWPRVFYRSLNCQTMAPDYPELDK